MAKLLLFRAVSLFGLLTLLVWETFYRTSPVNNLAGKITFSALFINFRLSADW